MTIGGGKGEAPLYQGLRLAPCRQQFTLQPVTGPLQPLHFSFNEFADVKVPRKGFLCCVDLHADELLDRKVRDLGDLGVFHGF